MYYHRLRKDIPTRDRPRVVQNLLKLRQQLDAEIPPKDAEDTVLIAAWNIRDFDKSHNYGYGKRAPETIYYIAEILSRFDLIAVQEVNRLGLLNKVKGLLGDNWDYIASDETDRALGGNGERLTFLFDKRKVDFKGIAGEIVLPAKMLISKALVETEEGDTLFAGKQFRRTPYLTRFQSGWFACDICTVHIYFGAESGQKLRERKEEIAAIAKYLSKRADKGLKAGRALILLGDFNIKNPQHETMEALTRHGFIIPKTLAERENFDHNHFYDQIAFKTKEEVIDYIERDEDDPLKRNAGIFDMFKNLYTTDMWEAYIPQMRASSNGKDKSLSEFKETYFKAWRTHQLSDHPPLWVRIQTDDAQKYLHRILEETGPA